MSPTQILIVLLIGLFVIKPDDIPMLIKQIKKIKSYFSNNGQTNDISEMEQLNFYIQKIISIEGCYDGDYSLVQIKEKYTKLVKSVISNDLNNINL